MLISRPDALVIGGGVIGLTTALALADRGAEVMLTEAGHTGQEASWAGAGILFPIYPWRYSTRVQTLAQRGRVLYPALAERVLAESGIDPGYIRSGLRLFDDHETASRWCREHHEPAETVSGAAGGGLLLPAVAQIRNPRLCAGLKALLIGLGVTVREACRVTGLDEQHDGVTAVTAGGERIAAGTVIVCAGAWSRRLLPALPIRPVKGQMLLLEDEPGRWPHILLEDGRYLVPRADGRLLIGSTVEDIGFDQGTDAKAMQKLREHFARRFPRLLELPEQGRWAGLRPASDDEQPIIGPLSGSQRIYANTGHFRNGLTMAPAAAEALLETMG
ncbi:MAG: hypothetical protein CMN28_10880 [Salinisphaeraceae bacterium]|nr:hypothetical protein [Salinisphaeraceae bacterium]